MITDRLTDRIKELHSPICVGLDPQTAFIPDYIKKQAFETHGMTPAGVANAFLMFNKAIIDAVCDIVPAVKPQIAMYEMYGVHGVGAYTETVKYAKEKGLIVIGDVKRGDIASTAAAYSDGHIGGVDIGGEGNVFKPFDTDFITVNPYLGRDSIEPFFKNCGSYDKGLFILVKTSNKGSVDIQDIDCGGETLYERVGGLVSKWGEGFIGRYGYSSIGAVVGATWPEQAASLRKKMPHTFFLIPGYGAQGGKAEDLAVCFDKNGMGGIVNSSRGIIAAHKTPENAEKYGDRGFVDCARAEVLKMREDLGRYINV